MRVRIALMIAALALSQTGNGWAQQTATQPSVPAATATDPAVEDVQANAEELSKQPIPDKDVLLLRELDRIDGEIARASQQAQKANSYKNDQAYYSGLTERINKQARVLAQFDCQNNSSRWQIAFQSYNRLYNELTNYANNMAGVDFTSIAIPFSNDPAAACTDAKSRFSSTDYMDALSQVLSGVQKSLTDFLTTQTNMATAEAKYLDALKKRRAAVQDKLNASQPAFQIGSNLWLLLSILAGASVATILGIKLFDPELQMEWVASGQVIQFVTVMILLSVVLALGLSSILKENTLGTLLGGIAGYVLAQGVGRSAARDVSRSSAAAGIGTAGAGATPGAPHPSPSPPPATGTPPSTRG